MNHFLKKSLMISGISMPILFVLIFLIDGATRPNYNPTFHWISHLSLGERGWLGITNLILFGLSNIYLGISLKRILENKGSIWGPRLIILLGIGLLLAGIFVIEPNLGYPKGYSPTNNFSGKIHDLSGVLVFGSLTAIPLVFSRQFSKQFRLYSIISGLLVIISFLICTILVPLHFSGVLPNAPSGLFERISMIIGCLWIVIFSYRLKKNM